MSVSLELDDEVACIVAMIVERAASEREWAIDADALAEFVGQVQNQVSYATWMRLRDGPVA